MSSSSSMDFNDGLSETKITPKQLTIIVGGILIAIVVVVFAMRWVQRDPQEFGLSLEDQRKAIEKTCDDSENKNDCIKKLSGKIAVQTGKVVLCEELDPEAYDGCAWEAANAQSDATLCETMVDAGLKQLCSDTIYLSTALASGNVALCDKIQDEGKRSGCQDVARGPITVENCVDRGEDREYCDMLKVAVEANQKQDVRICLELPLTYQIDCQDQVEMDDPDFDGLTTSDETQTYHSDPEKSDSDSDGYNDGDEVTAGYNPNGAGKLE